MRPRTRGVPGNSHGPRTGERAATDGGAGAVTLTVHPVSLSRGSFGGGRLRATWRRDLTGWRDASRWQDRWLARPAPAPPRPAIIQVTAIHCVACVFGRWRP